MKLDKAIPQRIAVRAEVSDYVRIVGRQYAGTPLGMGFGKSRFSSPTGRFRLLYLTQNPATAVAEAIHTITSLNPLHQMPGLNS